MNSRYTYWIETGDGCRVRVTMQTLPDKIHLIEQHIHAGAIAMSVLLAEDDQGRVWPLFHILPGFLYCRRLSHEQYLRWRRAPYRRIWRAIVGTA